MSKRKKMSSIRTQLGRKMTRQYLFRAVLYVVLMNYWLTFFDNVVWHYCSEYSGGYVAIPDEILTIISIAVPVIVWVIYTIHFFQKPLRYLEELMKASEQLAMHKEKPIELPKFLKEAQDELNEVRQTAIQNEHFLQEVEQKKNDLIMYLAHDLKTPLTSVIGYLTLLYENPELNQVQRVKYTGIALDKAQRLEELINEFFDITRLTLTSMTLRKELRNMSRMLEQIVSESTPLLEEKRISWRTKIAPDVEFLFDADKIQRVFDNLIRNAISYSYPHTTLDLLMKEEKGEAVIWLRNYGPTIPADKLKHLFEQFYRLDESRNSASGGAGLGLAIAKEIVELHQGTITAQSKDESIIFSIHLPMAGRKKIVRNASENHKMPEMPGE